MGKAPEVQGGTGNSVHNNKWNETDDFTDLKADVAVHMADYVTQKDDKFNLQGDVDGFISPVSNSLNTQILDNFEDLSGWNNGEVDTVNVKYGTQGLKLSSSDGSGANTTKNISADLLDKHIILSFYIDNVDNLRRIEIMIQTYGEWVKYKGVNFTEYPKKLTNGWNIAVINLGSGSWEGGLVRSDLANVTAIRFRVYSNAGVTVNVTFDMMMAVENPLSEAIVTITFDDGDKSIYTEALPYMSKYNMRGVAYVITDSVGGVNTATLEQLKTMYDMGWDISSHSNDHRHAGVNLTTIDEAKTWLSDSYKWLIENGFTRSAEHFAYPGGRWHLGDRSLDLINEVKKIYATARGNTQICETLPPSNPYLLQPIEFSTGDEAFVKAVIDRAIESKEWVILMLHDIADSPSIGPTTTEFQSVIDYIHTNNVKVLTMSEVKKLMSAY